mmetsp:Transcript_29501/g.56668  ORF Transcript_29501/g.56668 Transcript_29501/m.56668 type:complete len:247 (-) Transcript_29501:30-770(-)
MLARPPVALAYMHDCKSEMQLATLRSDASRHSSACTRILPLERILILPCTSQYLSQVPQFSAARDSPQPSAEDIPEKAHTEQLTWTLACASAPKCRLLVDSRVPSPFRIEMDLPSMSVMLMTSGSSSCVTGPTFTVVMVASHLKPPLSCLKLNSPSTSLGGPVISFFDIFSRKSGVYSWEKSASLALVGKQCLLQGHPFPARLSTNVFSCSSANVHVGRLNKRIIYNFRVSIVGQRGNCVVFSCIV